MMKDDDLELKRRPTRLQSEALEKKIVSLTEHMPQENMRRAKQNERLGWLEKIVSGCQKYITTRPAIAMGAIATTFMVALFVGDFASINTSSEELLVVVENAESQVEPSSKTASSGSSNLVNAALPMDDLSWQELLLLEDEISFASL